MFKKREKYNWITLTTNDTGKVLNTQSTSYVWWDRDKDLFATPLRSHMKRVKQKTTDNTKTDGAKKRSQCFKISRTTTTKHILDVLMQAAETHDWYGSHITPELGIC
jgi:hypothetical protein